MAFNISEDTSNTQSALDSSIDDAVDGAGTDTSGTNTNLLGVFTSNLQEMLVTAQGNWSLLDWAFFTDNVSSSTIDSFLVDPMPGTFDGPDDLDSAKYYFMGGTTGDDHVKANFVNSNGENDLYPIVTAMLGFSGNDVLLSDNRYTPMMMGGTGDDSYVIEAVTVNGVDLDFNPDVPEEHKPIHRFNVIETGNDDNDQLISYVNDWDIAADIDGRHLVLSDTANSGEPPDILIIWDFYVPEARIETFHFDFDNNGILEKYTFDEFNARVHADDFWFGSHASEAFGISGSTIDSLTQQIAEIDVYSTKVESFRSADPDTALSIARLYQAAFDRTPDEEGLNFWIDQWETENLSLGRIADSLYSSDEFTNTYGNLDGGDFVAQLYNNVLGRTPDSAGLNFWTETLNSGVSEADVLLEFSNSLENKINTELQLSGLTEFTAGDWIL